MMTTLADIFKKYKKEEAPKEVVEEKKEEKKVERKPRTRKAKPKTRSVPQPVSLDLLKQALREVLSEMNLATRKPEATEENVVRAVWDAEPAGIKYDSLAEHFNPLQARRVFEILLNLEQRNIVIRDRNGWYHINPRFMERVLEHYGIKYDPRLPPLLRQRIAHRMTFSQVREPEF